MKHFILSLGLLLAAIPAFATSYGEDDTLVALIHFDGVAFGKPVASVMAHTGVYKHDQSYYPQPQESYVWESVTDVTLTQVGDHFFGKAMLAGHMEADEGSQSTIVGFVVQYWVTFTDGTTTVTQPAVQSTASAPYGADENAKILGAYNAAQDSSETQASLIRGSVH